VIFLSLFIERMCRNDDDDDDDDIIMMNDFTALHVCFFTFSLVLVCFNSAIGCNA